MSDNVIIQGRQRQEPELFERWAVDDIDGKYSVSVFVGEDFAWCTCRDYWAGQHGRFRVHFPQAYYGATVSHGCGHVDAVLGKHGYLNSEDRDAGDKYEQRIRALERVVAELKGRDALLDSMVGRTYVISESATW